MTKRRAIKKDLEPSTGDYAHVGVRAGLSLTPLIGGPLVEFFSMIVAPPLEKRRDEWILEIYKMLKKVEKQVKGFKIEKLAQDEEFISTLLYATQVAMRTHQKERLKALRNIVVNSSLGITAPENFQIVFMNIIDRYSPLHLHILFFIENPGSCTSLYQGIKNDDFLFAEDLKTAFKIRFPELHCIDEYYDQIIHDLTSDGLIRSEKIPNREKMFKPKITVLGDEFLRLIRTSELDDCDYGKDPDLKS
jgi:hypothetical protein